GGNHPVCGCTGRGVSRDCRGRSECGGAGDGGRHGVANDAGAAGAGMPPAGDSRGDPEEIACGCGSSCGGGAGAGRGAAGTGSATGAGDGAAAGTAGAGGVSRYDDGAAASDCAVYHEREAGGDKGPAGADGGAAVDGTGGAEEETTAHIAVMICQIRGWRGDIFSTQRSEGKSARVKVCKSERARAVRWIVWGTVAIIDGPEYITCGIEKRLTQRSQRAQSSQRRGGAERV